MSTLAQSNPDLAINMIDECLYTAGSYNGRVFGGYVRDVIVPRLTNPKCKVKFNDVDVWFTKQENADKFIKAMGKSFSECNAESPSTYRFVRKQYLYYRYGTRVVFFDVIVSELLPVDDFDVNQLTYRVVNRDALLNYNNGAEFMAFNYGDKSVDDLKQAINNKTVTMLPEYKEKFTGGHNILIKSTVADKYFNRLKTRYLERGWNIRIPRLDQSDILVPKSVDTTWLRDNLVNCLTIDSSLTVIGPSSQGTSTNDQSKAEALEAFSAGLESMRTAFMKLLDAK